MDSRSGNATLIARRMGPLSVAITAVACTSITVEAQPRVQGTAVPPCLGNPQSSAKWIALATENRRILENEYRGEWAFNHGDPDAPPETGIALSGGGMRSASFCMGVLKAMQQDGELDDVDCMSSVSGGGYTLSWYYLQQLAEKAATPALRAEMFQVGGRFQKYFETHGRLLTRLDFTLAYYAAMGEGALENVLLIPYNLVCNGLFAWHTNTTPMRLSYENGIERAFQVHPALPHGDPDNNATYFWLSDFGVDRHTSVHDVGDFALKNRLPCFIVNTTAAIDDTHLHEGALLRNTVFEFTPLRYGSDAFGHYPCSDAAGTSDDCPISFNRAIAVSGAAADSSQAPIAAQKIGNSALNFDLGYNIANPRPGTSAWTKFLFFPIYLLWFGNTQWDSRGTDIHLSDGGHSENLGAFSLIRRGCRKIVIVDAEYDPEFTFEAYVRLKRGVREELGMTLSVPAIDRHLLAAGVLKDAFELDESAAPGNPPAFDPCHPVAVSRGAVLHFPYAKNAPGGAAPATIADVERRIEISYVKLSLDPSKLDKHSKSVQDYYEEHRKEYPQQSTLDQDFQQSQVRAYRDLGYDLAIDQHLLK